MNEYQFKVLQNFDLNLLMQTFVSGILSAYTCLLVALSRQERLSAGDTVYSTIAHTAQYDRYCRCRRW